MKVQVIKKEIPEEISEQGGCSLQIVNKETVDLETTVDEAKDQLCVIGDRVLVKGEFVGLFKSMIAGIQRDGNARTLGDFLTLYPVPTGEFDLDRGWDPVVNGVRIRARLLNEMDIDISKWEFEDVTPGRQAFTIESVQGGPVTGIVQNGYAIELNGKNLPETADVRVEWAVPEMSVSGTVPAAKVTSKATRCDIAADGIPAIFTAAYDGKRVEFVVRGNCANARIAATIRYVAPPTPTTPTVTKVTQEGRPDDTVKLSKTEAATIHGTGLALGANDKVLIELYKEGVCVDEGDLSAAGKVVSSSDTAIELSGFAWNNRTVPDGDWWNAYPDSKLIVVKNGERVVHPLTFVGE